MDATNKVDIDHLFDALKRLDIEQLIGEYSGSGDSGQFDGVYVIYVDGRPQHKIDFDKPLGEIEALTGISENAIPTYVAASLKGEQLKSLRDLIEHLAWQAVDNAGHGGFENDDGGYGKLIFDVKERTIELEHNDYVVSTQTTFTDIYPENDLV